MKNKTRVVSLLLVCMFLISATCSFASAASVQPTGQATVPEKMQPGSIIIYDDELQPEVVQGGYLKSSEHAATVTDFSNSDLPASPSRLLLSRQHRFVWKTKLQRNNIVLL